MNLKKKIKMILHVCMCSLKDSTLEECDSSAVFNENVGVIKSDYFSFPKFGQVGAARVFVSIFTWVIQQRDLACTLRAIMTQQNQSILIIAHLSYPPIV